MIHTIALWCAAVCCAVLISCQVYTMCAADELELRIIGTIGTCFWSYTLYGVLSALGWVS